MEILPFDRTYKRDIFSCGHSSLDNYILRNVNKDVSAGRCTCFVILNEEKEVTAYYTLNTDSVSLDEAPDELKKKINYAHIPVILLGRLAVDLKFKGKGYGKLLLADALKKSVHVSKTQIGCVAVIVDPINDEAENFYAKYGFTKIPDSGRMFMTIRKIEEAMQIADS